MEDLLVPFGIIDDGNTNDQWQDDDEFKGGQRVAVEGWDYESSDEYKSLF